VDGVSKPWAKYEIDFLDHSKFLALTANAICLWLEAKNYCDKYHTDGMFPKEALKTFRFNGRKSVELLMRSCGQKPDGEPYAPLWEQVDLGEASHYRMHDYLLHNDCREVVLARIAKADADRVLDRERKAGARAAKKAKSDARPENVHLIVRPDIQRTSAGLPAEIRSKTEAVSETYVPKERGRGTPPLAMQLRHTKIWRWMLENFMAALGDRLDAFDLDAWVRQVDEAETRIVTGEWWDYWQAAFNAEVKKRGLPMFVPETTGKAATKRESVLRELQR
jgi:hypothetical protein